MGWIAVCASIGALVLCVGVPAVGSCSVGSGVGERRAFEHAPLDIGPPVGAELGSFVGTHVSGSHAGRRACPLCVHGQKPAIAIWAGPAGLAAALESATALERVLRALPEWQAIGYVVFVPADGTSDADAERTLRAASEKLALERVFLTFADSRTEPKDLAVYRLPDASSARTTTVAYFNRRAAATFVDLGGGAAAEARLRAALEPLFGREAPYREQAVALCGADEPERKLEFWGRVFDEHGLPLPKASVLAYQTDASGRYAPPGSRTRSPRLCAVAVTDAGGWFRFASVEPGPYPGRDEPAHVHLTVTAAFHELRYVTVWFDDDPLVTAAKRRALDGETVIVDAPLVDGARTFRVDVRLEGN